MASIINVINKYYIKNYIIFRAGSTGFVLYSYGDRVSATTKKVSVTYVIYYIMKRKNLKYKVLFYVTKPVL